MSAELTVEQAKSLAVEVTQLRERLGRAGLLKTFHAMHEAEKAVGWEIVEKMERNEIK